jgi:hypothetical protein
MCEVSYVDVLEIAGKLFVIIVAKRAYLCPSLDIISL